MEGSRNVNNKAIETPNVPADSNLVSKDGRVKAHDNIDNKLKLETSVIEQKKISERTVKVDNRNRHDLKSSSNDKTGISVTSKDMPYEWTTGADSWDSSSSEDEDSGVVTGDKDSSDDMKASKSFWKTTGADSWGSSSSEGEDSDVANRYKDSSDDIIDTKEKKKGWESDSWSVPKPSDESLDASIETKESPEDIEIAKEIKQQYSNDDLSDSDASKFSREKGIGNHDEEDLTNLNSEELLKYQIKKEYNELKEKVTDIRYIDQTKELGSGAFAQVFKAKLSKEGESEEEVAYKESAKKKHSFLLEKEYSLLKDVKSPYIIKVLPNANESNQNASKDFVMDTKNMIFDKSLEKLKLADTQEDEAEEWVVVDKAELKTPGLAMEIQSGTLAERASKLSPEEKEKVFHNLLHGLVDLKEEYGIAHCDIKPENILIDTEGSAVIADFGAACKPLDENKEQIKNYRKIMQKRRDSRRLESESMGEEDKVELKKEEEKIAGMVNVKVAQGTPFYWSPSAIRSYILNNPQGLKLSEEAEQIKQQGFNPYEQDSWAAGVCIVKSYCTHLFNKGDDEIVNCMELKEKEVTAHIKGDMRQEAWCKKEFQNSWDLLIEKIPEGVHRELATGLLKHKWTASQALDYLRNYGLNAKTY